MPKHKRKKKAKKEGSEDFLNYVRRESYLPYKYRKKRKN